MLRALVLLLLLANAAFFAWTQGWLGATPRHAEREPERLAAQVRPEALSVLPAGTASMALQAVRAAAQVCLEAGPFTGAAADTEVAAAEAALAAVQVPEGAWTRTGGASAPAWLVYAGRYPEAALRKSREADLRKLGLAFELLEAPADLAPGLVLSRHATRDQAQAWLDARATPALRGVRLVQLPAGAASYRLRVAQADAELAERLRALPAPALAGGFKPCAAPP